MLYALRNGLCGEVAFDKNLEDIAAIFFVSNAIDSLFEGFERLQIVKDSVFNPI
jgi:hypothetical protein